MPGLTLSVSIGKSRSKRERKEERQSSEFQLPYLIIFQLGVLRFWPLLRFRIEGVPERVVRVVLEADPGGRVPLGVLLGDALLRVRLDLQHRLHFLFGPKTQNIWLKKH